MGNAIFPQSHHEESETKWPLKYISRPLTQEEIDKKEEVIIEEHTTEEE